MHPIGVWLGLLLLSAVGLAPYAFAQGTASSSEVFPAKSVRIIVPYTSGGGTDTVARGVAQKLSEIWGQPVVVENRPGGATMIGADYVAKSAPDGYTLLFSDSAAYVINPSLYAKMPYHPMSDLAPITVVCRLAPVLAISNAVPARSVPELIAYAQVHPGALSYGSFGSGSYPHVVMEQFKQMAGVDILHVPYKGSSPAVTDMIGGRLSMLLVTLSVFDQQEKAGKLKILAAATEHRLSLRPDLPTIAESVPGYSVSVWFGMAAPAGTPQRLIDRIYADLAGLLADPAFNEQFLKPQGLEPGGETPVAFAARWQTETVRWATLVRASGAKVE